VSGFDLASARALLGDDSFAPWVQALRLTPERVDKDGVVLRLPFDAKLCRLGGTLSGQALLAASDTAMVLAISAANGSFRPMTTVGQTMSFQKPVSNRDVLVEARLQRLGRTMAFGEVHCRIDGDGGLAAHATSTYALL
jgi:acyl-coenzyme A thioesterase PaaI-like protein